MKAKRLVILVLLFALFVVPPATLILYAVSGVWRYPEVVPETYSLRALEYLWSLRTTLMEGIGVSLLYAFTTVAVTFGMTVMPASFLARRRFRGQHLVESLLLAPALVPSITFSVGLQVVFLYVGLVDTFAGVVLVLSIFSYPYMLRALIAGFEVYGEEYTVCAANLGAGPLRTLLSVEIPLLVPSLVSGGTVVFLVAFSEYFLVFLIGGGAVPSITGTMFPFLSSSDRQIASALTLLFMMVPLVLFFLIDATVRRVYRRTGMLTEHVA